MVWFDLREAEKEGASNYIELPLEELRKLYTTDIQREFLQKQVVDSRGLTYMCSFSK